MTEFRDILAHHGLDAADESVLARVEAYTAEDVAAQLRREPGRFNLHRLGVLLSPAAGDFLEEMARQAQRLTIRRFGRTIGLYVPLYVSNVCVNSCLYCGYNVQCGYERTRLSPDEVMNEAEILAEMGFRDLLLLSGEDPKYVTPAFLADLARRLQKKFASLSAEIYPLDQEGYETLFHAGIDGVTLYQETYDRRDYERYHPGGPKADYDYRLDTPDRFARAGMRRIGLGFLLGLSEWRTQTLALALHAEYLMKHYWQAQVSFSFPRMRPAPGVEHAYKHLVSDAELVQMMLALRLCFADAGIVLSTRESAALRDHMVRICVTRMSAGSRTNPGGYGGHNETTEQFKIDDTRSPREIAEMLRRCGREAVWKDWDASFTSTR